MIRIENLVKSYGKHQVLKGVNIEVKEGEVYGFIGQNGAGKSTTMNILAGLIGFQKGKCFVNGKNIQNIKNRPNNDVGYLPEDPKFYPYMNALEYLEFIGSMRGDSKKQIIEKSERMLDLVKLTKAAKRAIGGYSRGMKQRLGIAVAIYNDPKVLLLDEPSSALDPEGRRDVVDIISTLKSQGKTIFLSTHILNDIERVCDRVGILSNGQIVLEENIHQLMKKYVQPVYDIEFDEPVNEDQFKTLNRADFVEKINIKDSQVNIWIKDFEQNSAKLVKLISELNIPIISINLRRNSLEEIFLKAVK
ncbi:ABC transporter ATP-binding protein [Acetivibrio clariflavus]|uniref:ABC-type multidrug transport system, ATPase component n=1 Tax=Acetivibrio clariflavus (strain DSM 19732 / NBRC 101661 / EBR45) TaxID=720554 RepID=G8LUV7_ACECE|nr:ABC transporter ATP-binding protein [Acetivibrio clariflavus]AEV68487.1 ABC-type multidrug transport system, ATPase component [Acetivibrio clariflavus DSM 19732]